MKLFSTNHIEIINYYPYGNDDDDDYEVLLFDVQLNSTRVKTDMPWLSASIYKVSSL